MTVERERREPLADGHLPFIATSILQSRPSMDRKPILARLSTGEDVLNPTSKIAAPRATTDHSTPLSSASVMATMSPAASEDLAVDDGACWNLVPYDVPWGQDYYQYKQGTLPGPDGACLFLRSPTPVEKRRTLQACKMCRERKAKCSGDKPACSRCLARGYICQYVSDAKKIRPTKTGPLRLKGSRSLSHPYGRRDSDAFSVASSTDFSDYSSYSSMSSSSYLSLKEEDPDFPPAVLLQQLQYPEDDDQKQEVTSPGGAYLHPYDYTPEASQDSGVHEQPPMSATSTTSSLSFWSGYESPHPAPQTLAPVAAYPPEFHAPRPLRYSQSLPFLPSQERRISCPADVINRPCSAEPVVEGAAFATTVDPRVLTQQPVHAVYYPGQDAVHTIADGQAVHANQWSMDGTQAEAYHVPAAMQDGALLMQQYCNVSPVVQYATSHVPEPQVYENIAPVAPHQLQVQYHPAVPAQPQEFAPGPAVYPFPTYIVNPPHY